MKTLLAVLTILLAFTTYKIIIYEQVIPRLVWSLDTMRLDYQGERSLYVQCERGHVEM